MGRVNPMIQQNETQRRSRSRSLSMVTALLVILVLILAVMSLFTGVYDITGKEDGWEMFFITRIPRTIALMLTGTAMAMSGLVMQLMTQNRFVETTTSGVIEWAGLGLIFVYLFIPSPTISQRMLGAIIFAFIGTMIFLLFLQRIRLKSALIVPITGVMMGAVVSSLTTFIGLYFNMNQLLETWFAGSFAPVQRGRYEYLWIILIVVVTIYWFADRLTILGLGREVATNLGLRYERLFLIGTGLVAISVGVVASVIGYIPFIGLIAPNIVTLAFGDHVRQTLPLVCLLGMAIILLCDLFSRTLIMPFEIPVSVILGTVGAFIFMLLLLRQRQEQSG